MAFFRLLKMDAFLKFSDLVWSRQPEFNRKKLLSLIIPLRPKKVQGLSYPNH